jgi:hypothetical protein
MFVKKFINTITANSKIIKNTKFRKKGKI